ncbi:MAG: hypothetical protein CL609_05505 [Anaerolineaceae bacterium]|nr:hypothetical protein [Anaerolineaceae bacterium]
MLQIFFISIVFIFLIFGLGLFFKWLIPGTFKSTFDWFDPFWIGFAILIAFLQLWHFALPVNTYALFVVTIVAVLGWFSNRKQVLKNLSLRSALGLIGLILVLLVLINQVLFSEASYDHGLYHLQTVKWFNQFPIVPGLGNLQHRLAFNSTNYLYAALLNTSIFHGYSYFVSTVILVGLLILQSLVSLLGWITAPQSASKTRLMYMILLPVILWHVSTQPLAGYPADMTIFVFQIVIFGKLLSLKEEEPNLPLFWQILILTAAASTVKLSFIPFGALVVLTAVYQVYHYVKSSQQLKQFVLVSLGTIFLWGLPWLVRNIFLSGYLLYPSHYIKLPFRWTMPAFLVNDLQAGISLWARTNSGHLVYTADLSWFLQWLKRFVFEPRGIIFLSLLLLLSLVGLSIRKKSKRIPLNSYIFLLPLTGISILIWFLSAPTYRFSGAVIWLFFIVVFLMLYDWVLLNISTKTAANLTLVLVLFLFFFLQNGFSKNFSFSNLFVVENEIAIAQNQQPVETSIVKTTASGLEINVPAEGELCWDLPLPCTTPNDFLSTLTLIDPMDMGKGFYIEHSE